MAFRLQALLDIKRRAEDEAERAVATAITARAKVEARQKELEEIANTARARVKQALAEAAATPSADVGEGLARERFRKRLAELAAQREAEALAHRKGPLAAAERAEKEARAAHLKARQEREALEKHKAKLAAEERKVAERRNEDMISDLAIAAHFKKQS